MFFFSVGCDWETLLFTKTESFRIIIYQIRRKGFPCGKLRRDSFIGILLHKDLPSKKCFSYWCIFYSFSESKIHFWWSYLVFEIGNRKKNGNLSLGENRLWAHNFLSWKAPEWMAFNPLLHNKMVVEKVYVIIILPFYVMYLVSAIHSSFLKLWLQFKWIWTAMGAYSDKFPKLEQLREDTKPYLRLSSKENFSWHQATKFEMELLEAIHILSLCDINKLNYS